MIITSSIPPVKSKKKKHRKPVEYHVPGYDFLGPGTDLERRKYQVPRNALDAAAKDYDIAYGDKNVETNLADKLFIEEAGATGVLGQSAAALIHAKHYFGLDDYFRPPEVGVAKMDPPKAPHGELNIQDMLNTLQEQVKRYGERQSTSVEPPMKKAKAMAGVQAGSDMDMDNIDGNGGGPMGEGTNPSMAPGKKSEYFTASYNRTFITYLSAYGDASTNLAVKTPATNKRSGMIYDTRWALVPRNNIRMYMSDRELHYLSHFTVAFQILETTVTFQDVIALEDYVNADKTEITTSTSLQPVFMMYEDEDHRLPVTDCPDTHAKGKYLMPRSREEGSLPQYSFYHQRIMDVPADNPISETELYIENFDGVTLHHPMGPPTQVRWKPKHPCWRRLGLYKTATSTDYKLGVEQPNIVNTLITNNEALNKTLPNNTWIDWKRESTALAGPTAEMTGDTIARRDAYDQAKEVTRCMTNSNWQTGVAVQDRVPLLLVHQMPYLKSSGSNEHSYTFQMRITYSCKIRYRYNILGGKYSGFNAYSGIPASFYTGALNHEYCN